MATNYASISQNKSKWINCYLVRDHEGVSFTLSMDEIAELCFKELKLSERDICSIDTHSMKVIKIELNQHVNVQNHLLTAQTMIRDGLYVQAMKEVKRERWIKINWVPHDMSHQAIVEVLESFGRVLQGPYQTNFDVRDDAPDLTKKLRSIKTNNRTVEISR